MFRFSITIIGLSTMLSSCSQQTARSDGRDAPVAQTNAEAEKTAKYINTLIYTKCSDGYYSRSEGKELGPTYSPSEGKYIYPPLGTRSEGKIVGPTNALTVETRPRVLSNVERFQGYQWKGDALYSMDGGRSGESIGLFKRGDKWFIRVPDSHNSANLDVIEVSVLQSIAPPCPSK